MTNSASADQAEQVAGVEVGEARITIPGMSEEGENLATAHEETEHSHGGLGESTVKSKSGGSRADRTTSLDVADFAVPTGREEEWRFSPLKKLGRVLSDAATQTPVTLKVRNTATGVTHGELALAQAPRGTVFLAADRAAVVGYSQTQTADHIKVAADTELSEPVFLDITGEAAGHRANGHIVLEAGEHSKAVFVMEHRGSADANLNVEVIVRDGADVTVVSLQRWDGDAVHVGQQDAEVGRDAKYKHVSITLGGEVVRLNSNVRYSAEGGEAAMYGLYFADAGQHLEHRSFVDHNSPRNTSNVLYKGALQGQDARTVWVGDVLIRKAAEGTDSYEKNQNLILTDGARADSIPNLEIETGLIEGAGHASSTGRFDENHLFYLMARGIPEKEARQLVVRGFLNEIVQAIGVESIEDTVQQDLENELKIAGF